MNVRQKVDEKAAGEFGGWSDTALMKRTYTHAEDANEKINRALQRGMKAALRKTRITLARGNGR